MRLLNLSDELILHAVEGRELDVGAHALDEHLL
jgi:hypothetical protein